jgi:hypothetical protein
MKPHPIVWAILCLLAVLPLGSYAQDPAGTNPFTVTRSSDSGISLRFELPQWKLEEVQKDGQNLQRVAVDGTPYLFIGEEETLPVFSTLIAIPYSGNASLNLVSQGGETIQQTVLDFDQALARERREGRYGDGLYPAQNVLISEPMVLRDFRVVSLNVYPFQYDQASGRLLTRQNLEISLDFTSGPSVNEIAPPRAVSSSFEKIYRGLILNYEDMIGRDTVYQHPVMLVVWGYNADTTYQAKVNEYINWKKQKGYKVYSVSTSTTGSSATGIRNYIQNAYDTWEERPEYAVLIGDTTGNMIIPTFSTYVDYQYTWLAGGDNLGDVAIGRISVENTEQMTKYIAKINTLERDINLDTAQWLNRMLLVGDSASSGISTIYTNEFIYDVSHPVNPDYTYTKLYGPSPGTTNINAAINQGVSFFNYRGYLGMSGWTSVNYDTALTNAYRLFHGVMITCGTGNFNSTGTTESVVRAGTEAQLKGAVTAIGMATSSTHTPMNNCLDVGIFHGLYSLGMRDMGEAMLYGKLYLHAVYGVSNYTQSVNFAGYCNLIGDPTAEVFVGIPETFTVTAPSSVPAGASHIEVEVRNTSNQPVEGAFVTLTNASGSIQVPTITDSYGRALLELPPTAGGTMYVTVNKHDFKPLTSTLAINASGGIIFDEAEIDDGYGGSSSGNGDGIINGGEHIELWVTLANTSSSPLDASGTFSCSDPYVTIPDGRVDFGLIPAGGTAQNQEAIFFQVDPDCPDDRQIVLGMSGAGWSVPVPLVVRNGKLDIISYNLVGSAGNVINPGDQFTLNFSIKNNGGADLSGINGILRSYDPFFTVPDSLGAFGNIVQNATVSNGLNPFQVYARTQCVGGMVIPLELYLYNALGFAQTISLTFTIGQTDVNDPLGQDAYGYFIYDMGDTAYMQCPTYNWVPIAPAEGGSGTALALSDPGSQYDEGDQTGAVSITTVNLPFPFTFYGETYTQASISSNGFIAFGSTTDSDWRNWRLPGAGGPNPMIAVFWDDLQLNTGSYVYTYFNSNQHYYVVEWYNVVNGYDRVTPETFQAILYDPAFYPTQTGDGQIKLQYQVFNNIDQGSGDTHPHGNFATIGIKDHNGSVGLEYTFNNAYPTAAAPLGNSSALFVTTRPIPMDTPYLALGQITIDDTNGNGNLDTGETAGLAIRLINHGSQPANNVSATLSSVDPYLTVTSPTASYGTIPAEDYGDPLQDFSISVAANCPDGHMAEMSLAITSTDGNWTRGFTLNLHAPALSFLDYTLQELSGNGNGILDPGESVQVTVPLQNTGSAVSGSGIASLATTTPGITITGGSANFNPIPAGSSASLSFTLSASGSVSIGTLAVLNLAAAAGSYGAAATEYIEVGAPLAITIGTGTSSQSYPLDRYYNYCTHEAIYLASEIGTGGTIKSIGYYKATGTDQNSVEAVNIYMKHTTATSISSGAYSLTGYTQVYSGVFPNNAGSGWMEVNLDTMYAYSGTQNLSILIVKGYQQWISYYPQWTYTSSGTARARQERSDTAQPTTLTATSNLPNLKIRIFPTAGMLYPPQNLAATSSHQVVNLTWAAPASGSPLSYKIYRDGTLLTAVSALSYSDLAVTNGTTYSYYLKATYGSGDSDPTATVTATPAALPPTGLAAMAGNQVVNLSWTGAAGRNAFSLASEDSRSISGYRVYRNGSPITTVTGTSYQDTGLINGVTYSYYVTTVYADPAGESSPSNTVTATPAMVSNVVLGTGNLVTTGVQNSPVNISNNSTHGQSVYTAAELNAAGVVGPVQITGLGFYVVTAPNLALPNFLVRMKHTTATNASSWHTAENLVTTYSTASYTPISGGYDMLAFSTPFTWNGVDNILIDTAFGMVSVASQSGTVQYTSVTSGYRFAYSNVTDQTNVFSGGLSVNRRPNVRLTLQPVQTGPVIAVDPGSLEFPEVAVGGNSVLPFSIGNSGDQTLTGSITTPAGFTVSVQTRGLSGTRTLAASGNSYRNTLAFSIPVGQSVDYQISFDPTASGAYAGNVVVSSNASNLPLVNIPVSGSGNAAPVINLPDSFEMGMDESLTVDLSPWLSDPESDPMLLSCVDTAHIQAVVDGMSVTFTPQPGWFGAEAMEFTVSDGLSDASDQVNLIVALQYLATPVAAIQATDSGVLIVWNAVPNAGEYHIYRSSDPSGAFSYLGSTTGLSFADNLPAGAAFYYVKAVRNLPSRQ